MENLEINLKTGLNEINFGDTIEKVTALIGEPQDVENLDMDDESTTVLNYWDKGITLFFEDSNKPSLSCIEVSNKDATLFGEKIFLLSEEKIIQLMSDNGFTDYEKETEVWGEKRITYEDLMLDLYFENQKLSVVSWGSLINTI